MENKAVLKNVIIRAIVGQIIQAIERDDIEIRQEVKPVCRKK